MPRIKAIIKSESPINRIRNIIKIGKNENHNKYEKAKRKANKLITTFAK